MTREEIYQRLKDRAYDGREGLDFRADVEAYFKDDFDLYSPELKSMIHGKAWEDGHAYGYHEVFMKYDDLVDIATLAVKQVRRCDGCASCINPCGKEEGSCS